MIFADQLLTLNGQPINDASALMKFLQQNGTQPVQASFARRAGGTFELTITPLAHPPLGDLFTLFIVPYLVSLAFIGIGLWTYTLRSDQRASRALLAFTSALKHRNLHLPRYGYDAARGFILGFEPGRHRREPGTSFFCLSPTDAFCSAKAEPALAGMGRIHPACRADDACDSRGLPILIFTSTPGNGVISSLPLDLFYCWVR